MTRMNTIETGYQKSYLGDGLYADNDGFGIIVTSENGVEVLDRIYFEPGVFEALLRYIESVKRI